ncbi:MAG: terminase large subunit domain-containing protein, partial [Nitrosarchaeum sp.]
FTWGASHRKMAAIKINQMKSNRNLLLPSVPTDFLSWFEAVNPTCAGKPRNFLVAPFWIAIYECNAPQKFIIGGRQIFKSTYISDMILFIATRKENSQISYITFSDNNKDTFSKQKMKNEAIIGNKFLSKFIKKRSGNSDSLSFVNGSVVYYTTSINEFRNIEGKSLDDIFLDESQYSDFNSFDKIRYTLTQTHGTITVLGLGGDTGSAYQKEWEKTDQREWIFDNPDWRNDLQFDSHGLIIDTYLIDVAKGKWVAQKPENSDYPGFHIPQTLFANIPLTIDDAINKYKISPKFSIESQKNLLSEKDFVTHTMGEFYKSVNNPITPKMVLDCMTPFRYFKLLSPAEIADIKNTFEDSIKITMGVDFGSGKNSHTVISIIIHWKKSGRLQLAYYEKCAPENQLKQAEKINKLFRASLCDIGIGDLGYAPNQIKIIQTGGKSHFDDSVFPGLGDTVFFGCRTGNDDAQPLKLDYSVSDEHGEKSSLVTISKSSSILNFIDKLEKRISHPISLEKKPIFIFPYANSYQYDTEKFISELCSISRRPYADNQTSIEFNHPPDTLMSLIYAITALEIRPEWNWCSA